MKKTNVARILDQHKIDYRLRNYDVDESDLSAGFRGTQIEITPRDLVDISNPGIGNISV